MKRLSILIAHEIPETCERFSGWLRAHHTASVHSARDTMSASRLLHFDVIVSALDLSLRPNLAAIKGIKHHQPWLRLLTIMGESYEASRLARSAYAMHQGANAILFHPFTERQLLLALRACWNDGVVPERCNARTLLSKAPSVSAFPPTPEHSP